MTQLEIPALERCKGSEDNLNTSENCSVLITLCKNSNIDTRKAFPLSFLYINDHQI